MEHTQGINKTRVWVLKGLMGLLDVFGPGDETQIVLGGSWEYPVFDLAKLHSGVSKRAPMKLKPDFTSSKGQRFSWKKRRSTEMPQKNPISQGISYPFSSKEMG